MKTKSTTAVLHDIRSAQNVGAIFRTADAAGISKIYLTGYTPTPIDRFGRARKDIAKASLGAELSIPWEQVINTKELLLRLKKENFKIVAIEQAPSSTDYKDIKINTPTAFVLGNEVEGISKDILSICDTVAEIPMAGSKESLNVSVAFGIAVFRMLGR